jgi:hypothetical protein
MTWEARMAARARERREWREAIERSNWKRYQEEEDERDRSAIRETMTLGFATFMLSPSFPRIGCACTGPPNCCRNRYGVARELERAAGIAAALIGSRP